MAMDPVKKAEWVRRLRSGVYLQGQGQLHIRRPEGDFYCCLGVLCEMAKEDGVELSITEYEVHSGLVLSIQYHGEEEFLPTRVQEWAGLADSNPTVSYAANGRTRNNTLSYLNDDFRESFPEIADIIEADTNL